MNRTHMFLVLLVGSFLWSACHSAQNCYLSTSGSDAANCTSDSPCLTISHCISQYSGDLTISLNNGTYNGVNNCNINIGTNGATGFTNLVIQALPNTSVTIDCQTNEYHFHFQSINATFTINSLTLLNGRSSANGNGGCVLASNVASLTIENVVFSNCIADQNGGALYTDSPSTVTDSTFTFNSAGNGGAVFVTSANNTISMTQCLITNNTAQYEGGGISVTGPYLQFAGNITFNTATYGGGVYLNVNAGDETLVGTYNVMKTIISNNTATLGGGLYSQNLNHTWNFYGALLSDNYVINTISNLSDPNVYCSNVNSSFCYFCKAKDCVSGCKVSDSQTCSQSPSSSQAFCYSSKFDLCLSTTSCSCVANSGFTSAAKILVVFIVVCMVIGIFLIAIDTVRHFRRKASGYTPISST